MAKWLEAHYNQRRSAVKCKKGPQVLILLLNFKDKIIIVIVINYCGVVVVVVVVEGQGGNWP